MTTLLDLMEAPDRRSIQEDGSAIQQCPHCGTVKLDWGDAATRSVCGKLTKTRQRADREDRTAAYREWRWGFGNGCYVSDIDHVEWRIVAGVVTPVAVLELTRLDGDVQPPGTYLAAILDRYERRDGQAGIITQLAALLGVEAWIVLFRWDLSEFWAYNLSRSEGWFENITPEKYRRWIEKLGSR